MPMDYSRYPADWDSITARIRERAGNCCEQCGAPNGAMIYRDPADLEKYTVVPDPISETDLYRIFGGKPITELSKVVKVILTVHHIGVDKPDGTPGSPHDKMDVRDENLVALCQRCHLLADLPMHIARARETRLRKRQEAIKASGQQNLFEV